MTEVMLRRQHGAIVAFCSKDETRRHLTGVHITPEAVVATDSYRIARITHPTAEDTSPASFPARRLEDFPVSSPIPEEGIVIPGATIKRALSLLPRRARRAGVSITQRVLIWADATMCRLTSTDLDETISTEAEIIDGTRFPTMEQATHSIEGMTPAISIAFDPRLLRETIAAFETFAGKGRRYHESTVIVELFAKEEGRTIKPARFRATNDVGMTMEAYLMPRRLAPEESSPANGG